MYYSYETEQEAPLYSYNSTHHANPKPQLVAARLMCAALSWPVADSLPPPPLLHKGREALGGDGALPDSFIRSKAAMEEEEAL